MVQDHIHFEIYAIIQVTHNHDNSVVFLEKEKCTIMVHDHINLGIYTFLIVRVAILIAILKIILNTIMWITDNYSCV